MQNIRTDLAVEARELSRREAKNATEIDGVISDVRTEDGITVTNIEITNENGSKALGKAIGNYITIESPNLKYSIDIYERVCTLISEEIRKMADIKSDSLTFVVGLGNRDITPDALGTEVVSRLLVTHHIKQNMKDFFDDNISGVCALIPGVLGTTGIETAEIIKAVSEKVKPNLIIAVDAMAAADIRPTVIDAATISKVEIPKELAPLMVTTKDIDLVIERTAKTVANGINLALHRDMTLRDIESYV